MPKTLNVSAEFNDEETKSIHTPVLSSFPLGRHVMLHSTGPKSKIQIMQPLCFQHSRRCLGKGYSAPVSMPSPLAFPPQLCGEISPVETMQPLSMLHVTMKPGAESWAHSVPWGHRCLIYVRRGDLTLVPTEEGYYEGEEDRGPQVGHTTRTPSSLRGVSQYVLMHGGYCSRVSRSNLAWSTMCVGRLLSLS